MTITPLYTSVSSNCFTTIPNKIAEDVFLNWESVVERHIAAGREEDIKRITPWIERVTEKKIHPYILDAVLFLPSDEITESITSQIGIHFHSSSDISSESCKKLYQMLELFYSKHSAAMLKELLSTTNSLALPYIMQCIGLFPSKDFCSNILKGVLYLFSNAHDYWDCERIVSLIETIPETERVALIGIMWEMERDFDACLDKITILRGLIALFKEHGWNQAPKVVSLIEELKWLCKLNSLFNLFSVITVELSVSGILSLLLKDEVLKNTLFTLIKKGVIIYDNSIWLRRLGNKVFLAKDVRFLEHTLYILEGVEDRDKCRSILKKLSKLYKRDYQRYLSAATALKGRGQDHNCTQFMKLCNFLPAEMMTQDNLEKILSLYHQDIKSQSLSDFPAPSNEELSSDALLYLDWIGEKEFFLEILIYNLDLLNYNMNAKKTKLTLSYSDARILEGFIGRLLNKLALHVINPVRKAEDFARAAIDKLVNILMEFAEKRDSINDCRGSWNDLYNPSKIVDFLVEWHACLIPKSIGLFPIRKSLPNESHSYSSVVPGMIDVIERHLLLIEGIRLSYQGVESLPTVRSLFKFLSKVKSITAFHVLQALNEVPLESRGKVFNRTLPLLATKCGYEIKKIMSEAYKAISEEK